MGFVPAIKQFGILVAYLGDVGAGEHLFGAVPESDPVGDDARPWVGVDNGQARRLAHRLDERCDLFGVVKGKRVRGDGVGLGHRGERRVRERDPSPEHDGSEAGGRFAACAARGHDAGRIDSREFQRRTPSSFK